MPKVGKKKFPYTPKGEKQAMAFAKKKGKKVKNKKAKKAEMPMPMMNKMMKGGGY